DTIKKDKVKKTLVITGWKSDTSEKKPLYVLNGEVLTGNLDQIEPDDLEKMEVLKGESAEALYGEKGKHGVILLTTKGGSKSTASNTVRVQADTTRIKGRANLSSKRLDLNG